MIHLCFSLDRLKLSNVWTLSSLVFRVIPWAYLLAYRLYIGRVMTNTNTKKFSAGFRTAMADLSRREMQSCRANWRITRATDDCDWSDGYMVALDHFDGFVTHGVRLAERLGLVDEFAGYYGQPYHKAL